MNTKKETYREIKEWKNNRLGKDKSPAKLAESAVKKLTREEAEAFRCFSIWHQSSH